MFRTSRYNHFARVDNDLIGYNARTGSFALLSEETAAALQAPEFDEAEIAGLDELVRLGFVHSGDELERVMTRYAEPKSNQTRLHLTLVPTLECNLACDYCFQNSYRHTRVMSAETQRATVRFVSELVARGRKEVTCTWFGGEPLLCLPMVIELSNELTRVTDAAGGTLGMSIVTNGTRLDRMAAAELRRAGVRSAQVTFDALIYDGQRRRGVLNPDGTLSPIIRNVIEAQSEIEIQVRINVSRYNMEADLRSVIRTLTEHGFSGKISLARVHDFETDTNYCTTDRGERIPAGRALPVLESNPTCHGHGQSLPRAEYARMERDSFLDREEALPIVMRKLKPKAHFCSATQGILFVIDPEGYISRCWHSAGSPSEALGNVHDLQEDLEQTANAALWRDYSPFRYPSCRTCQVLPLCMGGCSHHRIFMNAKKPPCESIKQQIGFCVQSVAKHLVVTPQQRHEL